VQHPCHRKREKGCKTSFPLIAIPQYLVGAEDVPGIIGKSVLRISPEPDFVTGRESGRE